jgi:hypothetical protein
MLSTHYSFTYSHPHNWLVLLGMMAAGAAIRQFFVLRHGYKLGRNAHPWPYVAAGVALIAVLIVAMAPRPAPAPAATEASGPVTYAQIQPVIAQRCYGCHGQAMQMKNVRLDSAALLAQHAPAVYQQAAVLRAMPMNNATQITEDERGLIKRWFEGGALVN